jgi:hypothetical protein
MEDSLVKVGIFQNSPLESCWDASPASSKKKAVSSVGLSILAQAFPCYCDEESAANDRPCKALSQKSFPDRRILHFGANCFAPNVVS